VGLVYLVSGKGIGRAIALRLADDGFDVAVNDIDDGELESLAEEIKAKGQQSSIHVADVLMEHSAKKLVEDVVKEHGGLDVVSLVRKEKRKVGIFLETCTDGGECRYS